MRPDTETRLMLFLTDYEALQQSRREFWAELKKAIFWGSWFLVALAGLFLTTKIAWRVFDL